MTLALFLTAATALSMPPAAQDHAAPAASVAQSAAKSAVAAPAAAAKFSLDTPIATLMVDARAKAAVEAVMPGVEAHPSYEQVKGMSFNQVAPMAPELLTPDLLVKLKTNLDAIK